MKIYLIAPRNPESFWTFDRILPSLDVVGMSRGQLQVLDVIRVEPR